MHCINVLFCLSYIVVLLYTLNESKYINFEDMDTILYYLQGNCNTYWEPSCLSKCSIVPPFLIPSINLSLCFNSETNETELPRQDHLTPEVGTKTPASYSRTDAAAAVKSICCYEVLLALFLHFIFVFRATFIHSNLFLLFQASFIHDCISSMDLFSRTLLSFQAMYLPAAIYN